MLIDQLTIIPRRSTPNWNFYCCIIIQIHNQESSSLNILRTTFATPINTIFKSVHSVPSPIITLNTCTCQIFQNFRYQPFTIWHTVITIHIEHESIQRSSLRKPQVSEHPYQLRHYLHKSPISDRWSSADPLRTVSLPWCLGGWFLTRAT